MKICLFGATGLLGSEFKQILIQENFELLAPNRGEVQLLNFEGTLEYLATHKPDLIINCAAYTEVDKAEHDADNCEELNVNVVRNLTKAGIPMIHFSTDYVFNAPENLEIPEDYPLDPQGKYAQSKAQAEEVLEKSEIDWWNIRTSWLFGPDGKNFVSTILKLSQDRNEFEIINDQIGRPTYAPDLARFIVDKFIKQIQETGHYHLQNSGDAVSWADFARYFLSLKNWPGTVKNISTEEYDAPADRPKNSVLKNTKIENQLPNWKEAVTVFVS